MELGKEHLEENTSAAWHSLELQNLLAKLYVWLEQLFRQLASQALRRKHASRCSPSKEGLEVAHSDNSLVQCCSFQTIPCCRLDMSAASSIG